MERQLNSPSGGSTIVGVLQPREGGLGTTDAAAARTALNALASTQVGVANGVAQLTNDGLVNPDNVPADGVTLIAIQGPTSMGINSVATFEITNYDAFTTYDLVALAGTVKRYKNTITYESSGSAGASGFRINGRLYAINVVGDRPATPTLTAALYGSSKSVTAALASSAFAMVSGSGTHSMSDWQIATDSGFDNVVKSAMFSSSLTAVELSDLAVLTTYYARVRYRDNNGNYSAWSKTISFATLDDYKIDTEERKIADPASTNSSGWNRMALSKDGSRMIVASFGVSSTRGAIYIFFRVGTTWTIEATIQPADTVGGDAFGYWVDISDDGTRVVASAINSDPDSVPNSGALYVFTRSGVVWTQEAKILANDKAANNNLGDRVAMDGAGTRIVATSLINGGAIYVFLRTGTTWAQEQKIDKPVDYIGSKTAFDGLAVAKLGDRIAVGYSDAQVSGLTVGSVYIYKRTGTTWTKEATVNTSNLVASGGFGGRVALNGDGSVLVSVSFTDGLGKAHVFTRSNVTWTQTAALVGPDVVAGDGYGGIAAVSDDGKRIVVTSYLAPVGGFLGAGAVYVFVNNGAQWLLEGKLAASDPNTNRRFGSFCDISGDGSRVSVSTTDPSSVTANQAIYIYR